MRFDWVSCEEELPPEDGKYLITNHPFGPYDLGILSYDGFGFLDGDVYKQPTYWTDLPERVKKYGKVKCKTE